MKNKCRITKENKKIIAFIAMFLLAVVLLVPNAVLADDEFAGGDGSPEQPFEIATAEQLATVAESVYLLDKHFILVNDIDLDVAPYNEDAGWEPIGTAENPFTGSFDGGEEEYTVTGLYINRPMTENVGVFGCTGETAEIRNLRLADVVVTGFRSVGSIAGLNKGTIENSSAAGDVDGIYEIGGLVGWNDITGSISYSYAMVDVAGSSGVGGLVGMNVRGIIENSYATGNLEGNDDVGGLVGYNYIGGVMDSITTITDSYATGDVKGDDYVGGLVGSNDNNSTIENSYATGAVEGNDYVGGLVGSNKGTITDSHATGDVEDGDDYVGGLVGRNSNIITDSYATCFVTGNDYVGGLVGRNEGSSTVANSYAEGDVGGINNVGGLVGQNEGSSTVANSYAAGDVEGIYSVGGLVAWNEDNSTIANSYAAGNVEGIQYVGGLVGCNLNIIENSCATGFVTGNEYVGGLVGRNLSIIENSYYDYETTCQENGVGMGDDTGVTGLSTADMKQQDSFEDWDFDNIWNISEGTYPYLSWQTAPDVTAPVVGGSGAITVSYIKHNSMDLSWAAAEDTVTAQQNLKYKVVRSENDNIDTVSNSEENGITVQDWTSNLTGIEVSGLSAETTYYFNVIVRDEADNKAVYNTESQTTSDVPESGGGGRRRGISNASPVYNAIITGSSVSRTTIPIDINTQAGSAAVNLGEKSEDILNGKEVTVITMPPIPGVITYTLRIPAAALAGSKEEDILTFSTPEGSITLPGNMLEGIAEAGGKEAGITIGEGDKSLLPDYVKVALGDRPMVQLSLTLDGEQVEWNNPVAPATVSIPYKPTSVELANPEHIVIWYIDGVGNVVSVPNGRYDPATGTVIFTTTHFSHYAVVYLTKSFNDLENVTWAKKQIEVLASKGILMGTSEKEYAPQTNITRADFLYYLVRTLGVDAKIDGNFNDISSAAYYYKEIGIAKKLGITKGAGNNKFIPDESITRQDMITLTVRALGMLDIIKEQVLALELEKFSDKSLISDYALESIAASVKEGLIVGDGNSINPLDNTTRAEAAVFLYRIYNKQLSPAS